MESPAPTSALHAALSKPARFLTEGVLHAPPPPRWATPNRVIREEAAHRLREFALEPTDGDLAADRTPVLVVPPEVNQSYIVDFNPEQSLVRTIGQGGFSRVAAVEWLPITAHTARRDIDDSVADILASIDALGGRAHLVGVCQGGWEATIATALRPEAVATLTLVAAPIDFHAGLGPLRQLTQTMPMAAYRTLVAAAGGRMAGTLISAGFDGLMPFERLVLGPLSLWTHLDDDAWLDRHHQLNDWYRSPKDLPGPLYARAVRELFKENRLIQGRLIVFGRAVDLGRIRCPVCLVAGRRDHITPPPQLFSARRALGTDEVLEVLTDGGHIGTFMGRRELTEHWPGVLAWLRTRRRGA